MYIFSFVLWHGTLLKLAQNGLTWDWEVECKKKKLRFMTGITWKKLECSDTNNKLVVSIKERL